MPTDTSFSLPVRLFLTIFHLQKFHHPVHHYQDSVVIKISNNVMACLVLIYWSEMAFPSADVCSGLIKVIQQILLIFFAEKRSRWTTTLLFYVAHYISKVFAAILLPSFELFTFCEHENVAVRVTVFKSLIQYCNKLVTFSNVKLTFKKLDSPFCIPFRILHFCFRNNVINFGAWLAYKSLLVCLSTFRPGVIFGNLYWNFTFYGRAVMNWTFLINWC